MTAGYWFVQQYSEAGWTAPEQRCADCAATVAYIEVFKNKNTDPKLKLRVHVPSHADDDERRQISELGVLPI